LAHTTTCAASTLSVIAHAALKAGDTAERVFWEIVETKAVPITGTSRPLTFDDRIAGVVDPDDEASDEEERCTEMPRRSQRWPWHSRRSSTKSRRVVHPMGNVRDAARELVWTPLFTTPS
jgi:hypothetical protein